MTEGYTMKNEKIKDFIEDLGSSSSALVVVGQQQGLLEQ